MAEIPYQMIANLRPQTTLAWKLKVRVTRLWPAINRQGDTVGIHCIFVDELVSKTFYLPNIFPPSMCAGLLMVILR